MGRDAPLALIVFALGGERYALSLEAVEEVAPGAVVRGRPGLPGALRGGAEVRGGPIPVLDLRASLGLEPRPAGEGRVLVTRGSGSGALGVLVDEVHGVREVPPGTIEAAPRYFRRAAERLLGLVRTDEGLILVLDAARLVGEEERAWLEDERVNG